MLTPEFKEEWEEYRPRPSGNKDTVIFACPECRLDFEIELKHLKKALKDRDERNIATNFYCIECAKYETWSY